MNIFFFIVNHNISVKYAFLFTNNQPTYKHFSNIKKLVIKQYEIILYHENNRLDNCMM